MITNLDNEKITAKTKAQDIIADKLSDIIEFWTEGTGGIEGMNEKEIKKVDIQLRKITNRLLKKIGYSAKY